MKKIYKEILYFSFLHVFFSDGKLDDERRINLKGDPKDFEENDGRCCNFIDNSTCLEVISYRKFHKHNF